MKRITILTILTSLVAIVLTLTGTVYCSSLLALFPYKKGDQVIFERTRFVSQKNGAQTTSQKETDEIRATCLGIEVLEGKEVLAIKHERGDESWKFYFSVDKNEIAEFAYQAPQTSPFIYDKPFPILKAPVRPGAEWQAKKGVVVKVRGVNESIATPRGEFNKCVKIEISYAETNRKSTRWYCPDYGLVKKVQIGPLGERQTYLVKYIRSSETTESAK